VGIGTLTPDYKLHVVSGNSSLLKIENSTALNNLVTTDLFFKTGTWYTGGIKTIGTGTNVARIGIFTFAGSNPGDLLERVSILDNGDVGIGTNAPAYKLDINGRPRIRQVGGNTAGIWYNKSDNTEYTFAGIRSDTVWGLYESGYKFNFDMKNSRLAIGAVLPQYPLVFTHTLGDKISLYGGAGAPNADHYGFGIQGSLMQLFTPTSTSDIAFGYGRSAAFTERVRIKGDGTVGIGTTTPSTKLQIIGGVDAGFATHGYIQLGPTNGGNLVIDNNEILARNNGLETDMWIQQDDGNLLLCGLGLGGVGIGVSTGAGLATGHALSVHGKIIAEELRIQSYATWPDYVFEKEYQLISRVDLREAINVNKHLPGIPSAKVVEEEGLLVGDMQKRMMEKIEELTLYILELNDKSMQQQAEIDKLKVALEEKE
jgi:hypothetical protein